MARRLPGQTSAPQEPRGWPPARARRALPLGVCFLAGAAVAALCLHRLKPSEAVTSDREAGRPFEVLSEGSRRIVQGLVSPVELRLYSVVEAASGSEAMADFARRVDGLLADYERESGGKVKLTRQSARSSGQALAAAAAADGIQAFGLEKGGVGFLGIAVVGQTRKESLSRLWPEWEQALEADLSRAIERVAMGAPLAPRVAANPLTNTVALAAVRRALPNLASVSVDEGIRTLRASALKEFQATATATDERVREAEQRLTQAQNGESAAQQQAARKRLEQVQAEQSEQLQQIAARSKAEIEAFRQLKETAP